jgi:NADH-quinone oxidoreductase subunit I
MASHGSTAPKAHDKHYDVIAESDRNPGVRTIQLKRPEPREASFLPAALKGLGITLKHFANNVFSRRENSDIETIQYPEEEYIYPERNRGQHRLMKRPDDTVRCVACMCCPTVCPAHCITIIPSESDDQGIEKKPAVFEIDELRCVVCGLCVEACPCDAIRMDTGKHAKPVEERGQGILTLERMLANEPKPRPNIHSDTHSTAVQGGKGPAWRDAE